MAQSSRSFPANFPPRQAFQMLRAETMRQSSILRQEFATELLALLTDTREPATRNRLIKLVESSLKAGLAAAEKAAALWPDISELKEVLEARTDVKPSVTSKHLKFYEQLDRVHQRSLGLLDSSYTHVRVILDRIQATPAPGATVAPAVPVATKAPGR